MTVPLVAAIAMYLFLLKKKKLSERKEFVVEFEGRELVQANVNRNLVYRVLARRPDNSIAKIQVVWTSDGRCEHGVIYDDIDETSVSDFNPVRFLSDGY